MKRVLYLDMCRGFTVLFIPIIHCVMLYSKIEVHHSWPGQVLAFIAEWPGGQVFMLMMGMWMAKSNKPLEYHVQRATLLLGCGYLVNAVKYVLPEELGVLPESFIIKNHFSEERLLLDLYTIGDIMHLSCIAMIIAAVIKGLKGSVIIASLLLVVVVCFSPIFWDLHSDNFILQHLLNLIGGHPNKAFFPVFPWMVFVLAGFVIGGLMGESNRSMATMFFAGAVLLIIGFVMPGNNSSYGFYRTDTAGTCMHLGFVLMWLPFWRLIAPMVSQFVSLSVTMKFCSKHITAIYFIQWVVVAWLFPIIGYRTLGLWQSLTIGIIVSAIVFALTYFFSYFFACPKK